MLPPNIPPRLAIQLKRLKFAARRASGAATGAKSGLTGLYGRTRVTAATATAMFKSAIASATPYVQVAPLENSEPAVNWPDISPTFQEMQNRINVRLTPAVGKCPSSPRFSQPTSGGYSSPMPIPSSQYV